MQSTADVLPGNSASGMELAEPLLLLLAGAIYQVTGIPVGWQNRIPKKILKQQISCDTQGKFARQFEFNVVTDCEHLRPPKSIHDLNETSYLDFHPEKINYKSDWCEGSLQLSHPLRMQLDCHHGAESSFAGVLENALRLMVAYDALLSGGLLMHSSAIVMDKGASVLFGHSGAGKSTTSQIAIDSGYGVLSDDINVLLDSDGGWQVMRVPFCGTVESDSNGTGKHPLVGLYRLQQHARTRLADYSTAQAISVLCGSAPFVNQDPFRTDLLLDRAETLIRSCPVKKLYFRRDQKFLKLIRAK